MSSPKCRGRRVLPEILWSDKKKGVTTSKFQEQLLRCWGRHVFPVFPEMLGKTLGDVGEDTQRCRGRQNIGEDTQGCRRRHSGMSGMSSGTSGMSSGHQDIKDVMRDVRDIIGDVREDFREDGDDMSSLSSFRCRGSHVFPVFI